MRKFLVFLCSCSFYYASAQNDRLTDHNSIVWLQSFTTVNITKQVDWLSDVQLRRTNGLRDPQQLLLRTAFQYRLNEQVFFAAGYAWVKTYSYGDYPIAANGPFPERRIHQQIALKQSLQKLVVSQRLRTEQRWVGKIAVTDPQKIEDWVFTNRFRYFVRLQTPIVDGEKVQFFGAFANEVFVNAGKNVGANIFDQNRLQILVGVKLNPQFSIEAGYLKQTIQQGKRTVNNASIIQNNDGATLALVAQL